MQHISKKCQFWPLKPTNKRLNSNQSISRQNHTTLEPFGGRVDQYSTFLVEIVNCYNLAYVDTNYVYSNSGTKLISVAKIKDILSMEWKMIPWFLLGKGPARGGP